MNKTFALKIIAGIIVTSLAAGGIGLATMSDSKTDNTNNNKENLVQDEVQLEDDKKEDDILANIDIYYIKGILRFAPILAEGDVYSDETIYAIIREILAYKHYMQSIPDIVPPTEPNPLVDNDVRYSEEEHDGTSWPVIKCNLQALERIASTYGYTGNLTDLIKSYNGGDNFWTSDNLWIEEDEVIFMTPPAGEFYTRKIESGGITADDQSVFIEYKVDQTFIADYIEGEPDSKVNNFVASFEVTQDGYIVKSIAEKEEYVEVEDIEAESPLNKFSSFGKIVLSQDKEVYESFVSHAESLLREYLEEYDVALNFEDIFYIEDRTTDADDGKYMNVVFSIESANGEKEYYRVEFYNELHSGGADAIISNGLVLDENNCLESPENVSLADYIIVGCDEDYLNEVKEFVENRFVSESAGPYVINLDEN